MTCQRPTDKVAKFIGFRNAKTHEHVKNEMSKNHALAIARVSRYLRGDKK